MPPVSAHYKQAPGITDHFELRSHKPRFIISHTGS
jgi:hypothetical protein